uniref:Uncharacterized protein n=2 Tax=Rhizobium rhizogenes TaxID=359 RepID=A0A7S4ZRZ8_RHIRH|nr:hypothetical protein pC5.8b_385 [Rhizobium rhizogenes]
MIASNRQMRTISIRSCFDPSPPDCVSVLLTEQPKNTVHPKEIGAQE